MILLGDIGGTNMRLARAQEPLSPVHIKTPQTYEEGLSQIIRTAREISGSEPIESIIAGVPGVLSLEKDRLLRAPHLTQWVDRLLVRDLNEALGATVILENDAALVGLGEAHYGAGRKSAIMVYITISTGVNGARIVEGRIDRSINGFEVGSQYLSHGDTLETFEGLVSGTAIHKKYGVSPKELGLDHPVWEELARTVAIGVHNTILEWSPDTIVLGGSMFNTIGINVSRVRDHLKDIMHAFPDIPHVFHAELGDDGGLYGGLVLSGH